MEDPPLPGLHHVSAICGDPQRNIDFYVGVLGLRLVKQTVNFDDPGSYHLYYGDADGAPGTLITFFAWAAVPPLVSARGRAGTGQIGSVGFAVPPAALDTWIDRLADRAVDFDGPVTRFGERCITVHDHDGIALEIVGSAQAGDGDEPVLRQLHGVAIDVGSAADALALRPPLPLHAEARDGRDHRYRLGAGRAGARLDLRVRAAAAPGRMGVGAIHHVAWRTPDTATQLAWRERLVAAGFHVTPVLDRRYFTSIYFRDGAGVIHEIATDGPGFTVDESAAELGNTLQLPPWLEERRERIVARLPALDPRPAPR